MSWCIAKYLTEGWWDGDDIERQVKSL